MIAYAVMDFNYIYYYLLNFDFYYDQIKIFDNGIISKKINNFITLQRWKMGKRNAEKDNLIGGSFFHAISTPTTPLNNPNV